MGVFCASGVSLLENGVAHAATEQVRRNAINGGHGPCLVNKNATSCASRASTDAGMSGRSLAHILPQRFIQWALVSRSSNKLVEQDCACRLLR